VAGSISCEKSFDCRAGNLRGVVEGICAHAKRANNRKPARQALSYYTLSNLDANLLSNGLHHSKRGLFNDYPLADPNKQISQRLGGAVCLNKQ